MPRSSAPAAAEALPAPSLEPLLGYLLAVAEVPARRVFQRTIGDPLDLRPVEFTLLALLHDHPHASPSQLAPALQLPLPHVSTLVDRLARRGLVARERDPGDRRALRLGLTAAGQALATRALTLAQGMETPLLQALTSAEQARLRRLLLKLIRGTRTAAC